MKKNLWIWIIVGIAIIVLAVVFADNIRLLFLPDGSPAARP